MLEANEDNFKEILKSSSIKLTWANGFVMFSLSFRHMANYNALKNN
jgi:hypothetical protein